MQAQRGPYAVLVGLAAVGCGLTGVVGFVLALINALGGEWLGAGVCLIAAALAFGLLLLSLSPR